MPNKNNKYLDSRVTYLLVLLLVVYAFFVCYSCYLTLSDQVDFGVVASVDTETVWRVSE